MTGEDITAQQCGAVLEVRLDRPRRRNALSLSTLRSLRGIVDAPAPGARAIAITAAGPVFSAGADFADLTGTLDDLDYDDELAATSEAVRRCPVPIVAAIDGPCLGAGVELALSCDVRVAGFSSSFRVPAVELGLLYNPDSIRKMHAALSRNVVRRMLVFAESFNGRDAFEAGLATHFDESDVTERALAIARAAAALPAAAMSATRRLLSDLDAGDYDENTWQSAREELLSSPERHRAVAEARTEHARDRADPIGR